MPIFRYPWNQFPPAWIHAEEASVKHHPDYVDAKSGDSDAAFRLVDSMVSDEVVHRLKERFHSSTPTLMSAHAIERDGLNAIPEALADHLGARLGWPVDHNVVQTNVVGHTGADGFTRLARQAEFAGEILPHTSYLLVDDFIGQGGTLANLRGFVLHGGGDVVGATVLTGKPYSAILSSEEAQILQILEKHGNELENWWKRRFGFGYDCLTSSEGRYLLKTPTADRVRDRIAAAVES